MKCADPKHLARYFSGQLSPEQVEISERHFERCDACAALRDGLGTMTARLAPDPEEFDDPDMADEVMDLIRLHRADRFEPQPSVSILRSWQTWAMIPATVAVTAVVMMLVVPRLEPGQDVGIQTRGSDVEDLDAWVSVEVFRPTSEGYEEVNETIDRGDALAFTYLNRSNDQFHFLLVLGVDSSGRVFWYYPQHNDLDVNPRSIAIRASPDPVELPEQIIHDLREGPLRIFALFSRAPLDIDAIEEAVQRSLRSTDRVENLQRLELEGVGQHTLLLRVRDSELGKRY